MSQGRTRIMKRHAHVADQDHDKQAQDVGTVSSCKFLVMHCAAVPSLFWLPFALDCNASHDCIRTYCGAPCRHCKTGDLKLNSHVGVSRIMAAKSKRKVQLFAVALRKASRFKGTEEPVESRISCQSLSLLKSLKTSRRVPQSSQACLQQR